jgi:hypothetical protein
MDQGERRRRLVRRHHLATPADDVVRVAGDLVGLHATDPVSIFLAARARTTALTPATLERALYEERKLLKILAMRRTMFVIPTILLPIVQAASSDAIAANERRRLAKVLEDQGITDDGDAWITQVGATAVAALKALGEATASQLVATDPELARPLRLAAGKSYEAKVSAGTRLLIVLAAEGHIVRGRPRGSWISTQYQWSPMETWVGPIERLPAPEARAELVRRWLRASGPATEDDVKWWTGWTLGQARAALSAVDATPVDLGEGAGGYVLPDDVEPEPAVEGPVRLLPALDPTAMGWRHREWYVGPHKARLFDSYGNIGPTVWCDGRIVGGWAQRGDGRIATALLEDIGTEDAAAVEGEAARLEEWLGDVRFVPRFRTPLERDLSA